MATETKLLTAEEFRTRLDSDGFCELERGEVVEMNRPGFRHGYVCNKVGRFVGNFVEERSLGRVIGNDAGVITQRDPDTVRGPDVAYFSFARLPPERIPEGYPEVLPDVVFEVLSPDDRPIRVMRKVGEYLAAGVQCVVLLEPEMREVAIHRAGGQIIEFTEQEPVVIPEISPEFRVLTHQFFT